MIDAGLDRASELSDRQHAIERSRIAFRTQAQSAFSQRRGRLTAEEAAVRKAAQAGTLSVGGGPAVLAVQPVPASAPPADPGVAFRTGVRGVLAVAVLALLFLWVRQRRAGVR